MVSVMSRAGFPDELVLIGSQVLESTHQLGALSLWLTYVALVFWSEECGDLPNAFENALIDFENFT